MPTERKGPVGLECLHILGAGGHAKVVMDSVRCAASTSGRAFAFSVTDDNPVLHGKYVLGVAVGASLPTALGGGDRFHVAIGDNATRERKYIEAAEHLEAATVIHPLASVCVSATLGAGSFIAAQAVVGPDVTLDEGCVVNHGAVVDHDCYVGAFSHIAPNATLGGGVHIGRRVLVGAGANILPGVRVGDNCVIGAGAVVVRNIVAGTTSVGMPASVLDRGKK